MSVIALFLIFSMLLVLWFDGTRYLIPNWLVSMLLIAYPAALYMHQAPIDWQWALAGAAIVLVIGYIIFAFRIMGGGDIKLLFALALWVGWQNLLQFMFLVSILGGVFAVMVLIARKSLPFLPKLTEDRKLPRILHDKAPVPYGVAIAFAFIYMVQTGQIPAL